MLDIAKIKEIATKDQTSEINITREYCQHLFLSYFYKIDEGVDQILFKGGTALRIIFQSPRYSEDLDFSANKIYIIKELLKKVVQKLNEENIQVIIEKSEQTTGGYIAFLKFDFPLSVEGPRIKINIQEKNKQLSKNSKIVQNKFIPPYLVLYLNSETLVEEKIEAFKERVRTRDFFDLYFMLGNDELRPYAIKYGKFLKENMIIQLNRVDNQLLKNELNILLPVSYKHLITGKGFKETLKEQIERYIIL